MSQTIIKCLQLTTSTNDAEALAAIRKANDMLRKKGLTWELYYKSQKGRRLIATGASRSVPIREMLDTLTAMELPAGRAGFIRSMSAFYDTRKRLSPKQHMAVANMYETYYFDDEAKNLRDGRT